ncbi:MAG: YggS family pyridoxal phosphate-dependent enzyme [Rikenellaceae bacterium]|nr:YggS family pyridoxal phosphate-dependent enzyme [Rikenellaceae bacterium]
MSVTSNLQTIRATLPEGVTLVAVSKFHPSEAIAEAYEAGQRVFGESRVQELVAKQQMLPADIEWHMIGHLQTNKVRAIAPFVSLIHSVDSARLLECINREAERCGRVIDCLLEVHVAREHTKSGWEITELQEFVASGAIGELKNIRIRGIMGMATFTENMDVVRSDFERLAAIKRELEPMFDSNFDTLSMGMSDDYPIAIQCGSTMVRVGSSIFGQRTY